MVRIKKGLALSGFVSDFRHMCHIADGCPTPLLIQALFMTRQTNGLTCLDEPVTTVR